MAGWLRSGNVRLDRRFFNGFPFLTTMRSVSKVALEQNEVDVHPRWFGAHEGTCGCRCKMNNYDIRFNKVQSSEHRSGDRDA